MYLYPPSGPHRACNVNTLPFYRTVIACPSHLGSKAWICGHLLAGIAGSNSAGACMSLLIVECCQTSVRVAEHSFRGVQLSVSLSVTVKPR